MVVENNDYRLNAGGRREFADSPLEGDGFEPSVPREIGFDFEASILSVTRTAQSGPLVDG